MTSRATLAAILVLAFVLRVFVIANTTEVGVFADMQDYNDRALHLLQRGALWGDAFRVPFFPIVIAGVYSVFGTKLVAVRVAQAVLGVLTVAFTYIVARRITTRRAALIAAAIVAVYPALLLYSVYVMAETTFAFLVMLAVALWTPRIWTALPAGLVVGMATLTRSVGLALLAGILVSEAWSVIARKQSADRWMLSRIVLLLVGFALALAPWIQRNYAIYDRFVPTDTSSGFNFLLGNYPGATGRHPGIPAVEAAAQTYWTTARNDVERSDLGFQIGRAFIREHPGRAVRLSLAKAGYLLGLEGREHAWGYSYHYQGRRAPRTVWAWGVALILSFPLLMIAASIGMWRPGLTRNTTAALILATLVALVWLHIASFGDSRFHLPWIPFLAILAGRAFPGESTGRWTWVRGVTLAVWLVCLGLVWWSQAPELLNVLPRLATSPVPLALPY